MGKLIFGCGLLGRRVAALWRQAGHSVAAVTRDSRRAEQFRQAGLQPIVADVTHPETLAGLPAAETVLYAVGYDPHGRQTRWQVYVEGLRAVLDAISPHTQRIIHISSTGVFGKNDGSWVDEDSPCQPTSEAGRALLAAEELLAAHPLGQRAVVLRMAGMYGPERLERSADLLAGQPIACKAEGRLNLIHVDDAATVVLAAEARATPPRTYVVSDGHPVERRTYFAYLAELLGAPAPRFKEIPPEEHSTRRGTSDKQVRNWRMLADLGIQLKYPSFREGLVAAVALQGGGRKAQGG